MLAFQEERPERDLRDQDRLAVEITTVLQCLLLVCCLLSTGNCSCTLLALLHGSGDTQNTPAKVSMGADGTAAAAYAAAWTVLPTRVFRECACCLWWTPSSLYGAISGSWPARRSFSLCQLSKRDAGRSCSFRCVQLDRGRREKLPGCQCATLARKESQPCEGMLENYCKKAASKLPLSRPSIGI